MLEIKEGRRLLKSEKSAVLNTKKVNDLVNRMSIVLSPNTVTLLRKIVNLTESVFSGSYFVETFKGEAIRIANYNVFKRTIKFAKDFFSDKSKKYVLEIKEVSGNEIILEIFFKKVSILKIKFSSFLPIEFDFLKNDCSYEELFKHYQDAMLLQSGEPDEIKEFQHKLENIIEFGAQGIDEVKNFFEKYIEEFSINLNLKYSWYVIKTHDLKHF